MAQIIGLTTDARQTLDTRLGGQSVSLSVWWQPLSEAWYLSLRVAGQPVALGRQIAPWSRLIAAPSVLDGDLIAAGRNGHERGDLGRQAWQDTHQLVYLTAEELSEL